MNLKELLEEIERKIKKNQELNPAGRCSFARKNETVEESEARRKGFLSGLLIAKDLINKLTEIK